MFYLSLKGEITDKYKCIPRSLFMTLCPVGGGVGDVGGPVGLLALFERLYTAAISVFLILALKLTRCQERFHVPII